MITNTWVTLLLLLFSCFANGQTYIGLKAGMNFSNVVWKETVTKHPTKFNTGFHLGFTSTSPIKFRKHKLFI